MSVPSSLSPCAYCCGGVVADGRCMQCGLFEEINGCAGGQGKSPEQVARDGRIIGVVLLAAGLVAVAFIAYGLVAEIVRS